MIPRYIGCRLQELMDERRVTPTQLHERSGVSIRSIRKLCADDWEGVERETLARICAALDVTLAELFETVPEDAWYPIRRAGRVTVHLGSTSLDRPRSDVTIALDRMGIGTWDIRGFFTLSAFLSGQGRRRIEFDYAEHTETAYDPAAASARLDEGSHLILGSPLVNPMAEDAVCRGFGVPARDRSIARQFPLRFRWNRASDSSFGEYSGLTDPGIVRRDDKEPIARRTVIEHGDDGEDCGLLYSYRSRPRGAKEDCIVIAIMGHSGCGTLAGAELLQHDDVARAMYPLKHDSPVLRAFRVRYAREGDNAGYDDRRIIDKALVPLD